MISTILEGIHAKQKSFKCFLITHVVLISTGLEVLDNMILKDFTVDFVVGLMTTITMGEVKKKYIST